MDGRYNCVALTTANADQYVTSIIVNYRCARFPVIDGILEMSTPDL